MKKALKIIINLLSIILIVIALKCFHDTRLYSDLINNVKKGITTGILWIGIIYLFVFFAMYSRVKNIIILLYGENNVIADIDKTSVKRSFEGVFLVFWIITLIIVFDVALKQKDTTALVIALFFLIVPIIYIVRIIKFLIKLIKPNKGNIEL